MTSPFDKLVKTCPFVNIKKDRTLETKIATANAALYLARTLSRVLITPVVKSSAKVQTGKITRNNDKQRKITQEHSPSDLSKFL